MSFQHCVTSPGKEKSHNYFSHRRTMQAVEKKPARTLIKSFVIYAYYDDKKR